MNQPPSAFEIPVSLVRDYQQINREILLALDSGHRLVRLTEVEGQRLLASGLRGPWDAVIEVIGNAGPELGAGLDAPGVTILCHGSAADGAGRGLRSGRLAISERSGDALGAWMSGGAIVVRGATGHRAGLRQRGGTLVLLGEAGRLLADRHSGGLIMADPGVITSASGRGRSEGLLVPLPQHSRGFDALSRAHANGLLSTLRGLPREFRLAFDLGPLPD
ncbi:glutamate synthase [Tautonia sp. JC769]|uniref:GltB/FmdC/FwdC-like GXGXG domain-containing protein n=1 Tax=Tautonia sp. JC769 TaxID=3232135 RepID=UPI003458AEEF